MASPATVNQHLATFSSHTSVSTRSTANSELAPIAFLRHYILRRHVTNCLYNKLDYTTATTMHQHHTIFLMNEVRNELDMGKMGQPCTYR
jgi:hypothetical protein